MASKMQLDGILQHRRKIVEKEKGEKMQDQPENAAAFTPLRQSKSADFMPEKSKSPTPKREISKPDPAMFEESEEVQIPCEFCEVLVPVSRLLIHQVHFNFGLREKCVTFYVFANPLPQTGCRPDITSFIPYKHQKLDQASSPDSEFDYTVDAAANCPKTQTKNLIPCDLCNASIPADKFIQHQVLSKQFKNWH
jgi:hypothetical protein